MYKYRRVENVLFGSIIFFKNIQTKLFFNLYFLCPRRELMNLKAINRLWVFDLIQTTKQHFQTDKIRHFHEVADNWFRAVCEIQCNDLLGNIFMPLYFF